MIVIDFHVPFLESNLFCLFLSNAVVPIELVDQLKIPFDVALYYSFMAGNDSLAIKFKLTNYDVYLKNIKGFIDRRLDLEFISDHGLVTMLTDLLEKYDNHLAKEILEIIIKNDNIISSIVNQAIDKDNFVFLNKIIDRFPDIFADRQSDCNYKILALANHPKYLPLLITAFNKNQGAIQATNKLTIKQFIDAKYETLLPVFQEIQEHGRNKPIDKEDVDCCFYMIKALISLKTDDALDKITNLLSIPEVISIAHRDENVLLTLAHAKNILSIVDILMAIPKVKQKSELASIINPSSEPEDEDMLTRVEASMASKYIGRESAQKVGLTNGAQRKISILMQLYPSDSPGFRKIDNLIASLKEKYLSSPVPCSILKDDGKTIVKLPLTWSEYKALALTPSENERALRSYYGNIYHTAWRFLQRENPWMDTYTTEEQRKANETYAHQIEVLWTAANDLNYPPVGDMTLEHRVEIFIGNIAALARSNSGYLDGDIPACDAGVPGHLSEAVANHPMCVLVTDSDINKEFNAYILDLMKSKINDGNRDSLITAYKNYIPLELSEEDKRSLSLFNISPEEKSVFVKVIEKKYGKPYVESEAFRKIHDKNFELNGKLTSFDSHFMKHLPILECIFDVFVQDMLNLYIASAIDGKINDGNQEDIIKAYKHLLAEDENPNTLTDGDRACLSLLDFSTEERDYFVKLVEEKYGDYVYKPAFKIRLESYFPIIGGEGIAHFKKYSAHIKQLLPKLEERVSLQKSHGDIDVVISIPKGESEPAAAKDDFVDVPFLLNPGSTGVINHQEQCKSGISLATTAGGKRKRITEEESHAPLASSGVTRIGFLKHKKPTAGAFKDTCTLHSMSDEPPKGPSRR